MQVDEAPTPDRQDGKQVEHVASLVLPEESKDGNIRVTTAAPEFTPATFKEQPGLSADEPSKMSQEQQVTIACPLHVIVTRATTAYCGFVAKPYSATL